MRILLVEDQVRFAELLKKHLSDAGYVVDIAPNISSFEAHIRSETYDLLIVDIGLPDGDGLETIKEYRSSGGTIPVIVVTARNMVSDLVKGLDCGADDYLTKPFHIDVLKARIRAVLRRPKEIEADLQTFGYLKYDQQSGEILSDKGVVDLTPAERRLLALLIRRAGSVVSKCLIDDQVYGCDGSRTPNAVEKLVSRLRKSLVQTQAGVDVRTVRGVGYVLEEQPG